MVEIGSSVLEALAAAHARGVVHKDVKPSNVLFDAEGRAKVCDFGIGTLALGDSNSAAADGTALVGTPHYAAPEQEDPEREGPLEPSADLYSFGKLLFALLTGRPPRGFRPPSSVRAGLDPAWDALVLALTEESPADRPTAEVALATLRRMPLAPPAASRWPRFWVDLTGLANLAGSVAVLAAAFLPDLRSASASLLACGLVWAAAGLTAHDVGSRLVRGRSCPSIAIGAAIALPLLGCGLVLVLSASSGFGHRAIGAWPWWARVQVALGAGAALIGLVGSGGLVAGLFARSRS